MTDLDEDDIEQNLINLLKSQGYDFIHASDLERDGFDSVVLEKEFKASLKKLVLQRN